MCQADWVQCFDEAVAKASQAPHPAVRIAYLELAQFYRDQAYRTRRIMGREPILSEAT